MEKELLEKIKEIRSQVKDTLIVRPLREDDWDTLVSWWKDWPNWENPPKGFLPDNGTGVLKVSGSLVQIGGSPTVSADDMNDNALTVVGDLNVTGSGKDYGISASFGAPSNTTTRWDVGYHGNDEFIPIFPGDFGVGEHARELGNLTDDFMGSIETSNASYNFFGTKIIPKGFSATSAVIYGSNTSATHRWAKSNITGSGQVWLSGATAIDTAVDLSPNVVGSGDTYVIVMIAPDNAADNFYGGKIYISRTT